MNLVKHNRDVYITQKLDGAHGNGASGIVVGAPSSGTRYLQRKQEEIGQAQFWNQAQPMVSSLRGPPAEPNSMTRSEYWSKHHIEEPPRGCGAKHTERSCMANYALESEYKHHVGGGMTSAVDVRRACGTPEPSQQRGGGWFCSSGPTETVLPDKLSEGQYWGQAKTHGVNEIQARNLSARYERAAMVHGTLSTQEYQGVVHSIAPMEQADHIPSQNRIDNFWYESDLKSKVEKHNYGEGPGRPMCPTPGGGHTSDSMGTVNMK